MALNRLAIAAIVDRLMFDTNKMFNMADANELNRLLPMDIKMAWWHIGAKLSHIKSGRATQGVAAGVGNVSMPNSDRTIDFDNRGKRVVRAGQWRLYRIGSDIDIEQVASSDGEDEKSVRIKYANSKAFRMESMVRTHIGWVSFGRLKHWKYPTE